MKVTKSTPSPLARTAAMLHSTQRFLDSLDRTNSELQFSKLPLVTQAQLERLWGILYSDKGRKNVPASDGIWSNPLLPGDSIWIPDSSIVPSDKGYSNMLNKTWSTILSENHIQGIPFSNGWPDFECISKASVSFDWEQALGEDRLRRFAEGERSQLHDVAFRLLSIKRHESIEMTIAWKEKENLVWHENQDCQSVLLVPREVHDNIKHIGGRSMLQVILG